MCGLKKFLILITAPAMICFSASSLEAVPGLADSNINLLGAGNCSLSWGDYDNDGDLDLALAGNAAEGPVAKIYRNDNKNFVDSATGLSGVDYCSLSWGDYDNDGDLDLALSGRAGDKTGISRMYRNDNAGFLNIAAGLPAVEMSALSWGDYDNDGDLDIALSGGDGSMVGGVTRIFRNEKYNFVDSAVGMDGVHWGSLSWGDYDNDGDLDLAYSGAGLYQPISRIYRNDNGAFSDSNAGLIGLVGSSLSWGDYDNDGYMDLAHSGSVGGSSVARIYRNDNGSMSDSNAAVTSVEGCALSWGDYDHDGDLDLALAGRNMMSHGVSGPVLSRVYGNNNGGFVDSGISLTGAVHGSLSWGDYDNDGDLDLALAGYVDASTGTSVSRIYQSQEVEFGNIHDAPNAPYTGFSTTYSTSTRMLSLRWGKVPDTDTSPSLRNGLYYEIRLTTQSAMGDSTTNWVISPSVGAGVGSSPSQRLGSYPHGYCTPSLTPGIDIKVPQWNTTYYWQVRTIDPGLRKSAWSAVQSCAVVQERATRMTIYSIRPSAGMNNESASAVNVYGQGFAGGATVNLSQTGQSDIAASSVTVISDLQLSCSFNLLGAATGYWNVVVSTGGAGALSSVLENGFEVRPPVQTTECINFDDLPVGMHPFSNGQPIPEGSQLSDHYLSSYGVRFYSSSPYVAVVNLNVGSQAPSAPNGIGGATSDGTLVYNNICAGFFDPSSPNGPAVTDYVAVTVDKWGNGGIYTVTLNAYDVYGTLVDSCTMVDAGGETLHVSAPAIHSVQFLCNVSGDAAIDNFTFNAVRPVAVSTPLAIASIMPSTGINTGPVRIIQLKGNGFADDVTLILSKTGCADIVAQAVTVRNDTHATCTFDLTGAATGYWHVVAVSTAAGYGSAVLENGFLILSSSDLARVNNEHARAIVYVEKHSGAQVILGVPYGKRIVTVPAGTFDDDVALTVSTTTVPVSDRETIRTTGIGLEITNDKGLQPNKDITIEIIFTDDDVVGLDRSKLVLARYDEQHRRWVPIPSACYPEQNKVVGRVRHLSLFAVVQLAPASDLHSVKGFPNPYNPALGLLTFDDLTDNAEIRIYTIAGELVRTVDYASSSGRAYWDGKNDGGATVASGVYIVLIKSPAGTKKLKIAVQK